MVSVSVLDEHGQTVPAHGIHGQKVPHAFGMLRASHRTLDPERSSPYRPYHAHTELTPVPAGQPIPLDIELWPTSIVLSPGHRLRVVLSSTVGSWSNIMESDQMREAGDGPAAGTITVHTGGEHDSAFLLPTIPNDA